MRIRFWQLREEVVQRDLAECEVELRSSFVLIALISRAKRQGRQIGEHAGSTTNP